MADGDVVLLTAAVAGGLAATHVLAGKLRFLGVTPRSGWLSGASGISVAYVFVHVLPDLAEGQAAVREAVRQAEAGAPLQFLEHHVYLLALVGMMTFYGLERLAKSSRAARSEHPGEDVASPGVFWIHAASFAVYNAMIGYLLLHRDGRGTRSLLLFSAAIATHFLVNDYGLRRHHRHRYDRYGRWMLAAAVLAGWAVGAAAEVHDAAVALLFAFLAGGILVNVLKEELPEERKSTFWALAAGAAGYTVLLLAA